MTAPDQVEPVDLSLSPRTPHHHHGDHPLPDQDHPHLPPPFLGDLTLSAFLKRVSKTDKEEPRVPSHREDGLQVSRAHHEDMCPGLVITRL